MNYIDELEREKAHSDSMKAAAQMWMQRAQAAERTLMIVVHAAGDHVVVRGDHVFDGPRLKLIRMEQQHDMTTHFRTKVGIPTAE